MEDEDRQVFESHGPFETHKITIGGIRVPYLSGRVVNGMLHLCLDERFGCEIPEEYATSLVWFIANAMAVSAGYSCFGRGSQKMNIFNTKLSAIDIELVNGEIQLDTKSLQ